MSPTNTETTGGTTLRREIDEAVAALRRKSALVPEVAVILGTGLGSLSDSLAVEARVPYGDIPHFAASTVEGHKGELVFGRLAGRPAVVMNGRVHYYEGYTMRQVSFPVRVLKALGAHTLVVSNAVGGMNPLFVPGDIMIVTDHINLMGDNPLLGPNDDTLGPRFPDMVGTYTEELRRIAHAVDPDLREGVYVGVAGPNYETPAELRMMRRLGADAVGMSTVPEILVARHMGMRILAIATVTDMATGLPGLVDHVTHEEVLAVADRAGKRLGNVVKGVVARL